jgi:hypothetical protein
MKVIETEGCSGGCVSEEFLVEDRGRGDVKLFTVGEIVSFRI